MGYFFGAITFTPGSEERMTRPPLTVYGREGDFPLFPYFLWATEKQRAIHGRMLHILSGI